MSSVRAHAQRRHRASTRRYGPTMREWFAYFLAQRESGHYASFERMQTAFVEHALRPMARHLEEDRAWPRWIGADVQEL